MKKQFLILFAFISVLALSQVPQRFNKVIVTGDITSPKFIKTGSTADSVLLGNGSALAISAIKTDTVSLSNRINAKASGNGTANGTNTGDETLTSIKTKLGAATSVSDGYLKYQDWNTFNSKEPAITKKSGFNLPLGNTTGTILEGRTFGTAANSAVGDFQPTITGLTTGYTPKWAGSAFINSLTSDDGTTTTTSVGNSQFLKVYYSSLYSGGITLKSRYANTYDNAALHLGASAVDAGSLSLLTAPNGATGLVNRLTIDSNGIVSILSTTTSTSPTTGALVVNGGIGADHVRANNFYGNGSTLTGVQLPITLTTNGTSGAATFSGNVLNVPNYDGGGGVYQAQTTVNGSTSGNMVCSMPFRTGSYKKVMIRFSSLSGGASYSYPTAFTTQPSISSIYQQVGASGTYPTGAVTSAFTITGASGLSGWIIIEGY